MCFGFLGIQFGFALQNTNVSRIFQTLGADIDDIPILWVAAPVTGLLVQPIIGYMSDRTWNRMGRRRPYFLWGAILASAALIFMPNSPYLWVAAGMLWIMDASINIAMEPFRAFVGDMLPQRQRTTGYAMQSFFIGIGSVIASCLPWIFTNWLDISNVAPAGEIPDTVKYAFYFGGGVMFLAVMWTIYSTKEYSPEQLREFDRTDGIFSANTRVRQETRKSSRYLTSGMLWLVAGLSFTGAIYILGWDGQLYILGVGSIIFGLLQFICAMLQENNRTENGFYQIMDDFFHIPGTMKQLAVVQFFSWFALFSMWIYTTPAVTSYHYGSSDPSSLAYNEGADWVGILFGSYNVFAALAAFLIPVVAMRTNRKIAHMINLFLGGAGLISMYFIKDPTLLWISMIGVGIAWASILSMPYSLLSSALPSHKMGVYMGIFNFFIVIPQILAASVLGLLVKHIFDGQAIYALVFGGCLMILAGLATLWVEDCYQE
ncbi:Predicted maltose transporter MalT [hydrothermal vent metagenome]|uniref:Predicted maltose transporter MalT n=1 Tax=hydrothermal vent metagenome TaxID=652676 RepID=A0A3B0RVJ0_9ZZZZ